MVKAIQTHSRKETEDPEYPAGARKPKPAAEAKDHNKEKVTTISEITTEEPEFGMSSQDMEMPPCYFRNILANKYEMATLGVDHIKRFEECNAAITNQGFEKQRDPGCPTTPCSIGPFKFKMALCDLRASVSVMPRDVFEKLRLPELEHMAMCLELGDNSIHYPLGITEDVSVKVGDHFISVDFVILEMGEREKSPLILGRLFLETVGATIDIGKREIKFDINGTRGVFKFHP
jgi:hypothetical protein